MCWFMLLCFSSVILGLRRWAGYPGSIYLIYPIECLVCALLFLSLMRRLLIFDPTKPLQQILWMITKVIFSCHALFCPRRLI